MPAPLVGFEAFKVQSVAAAVPPLSLMTSLTSVSWAGWSSLTIAQKTVSPSAGVTDVPSLTAAPVHAHDDAAYPGGPGPLPERTYRPGKTSTFVTGGGSVGPELPAAGPSPFNVHSLALAVTPFSLMTAVLSVRCAVMSSFVIVHVAFCPTSRVTAVPVACVAPVQTHADAE